MIRCLQIQEIEINVDEQEEHGEKKSAKEALMMWCQRNTRGYREVHVRVCATFIMMSHSVDNIFFSWNRISLHHGEMEWLSTHCCTTRIPTV